MPITFDRNTGQYRGEDGRFVPRSTIESLISNEIARNQRRSQELTTKLISGDLELGDWQRQIMQTIKDSHLRLGILGAGGVDNASPSTYGTIGSQIKDQYKYLALFATSIEASELSEAQIRVRLDQYMKSSKITFYKIELKSRVADGFQRGKRLLDRQSKHCEACLGHERPMWVNLSDIIAPGTDCQCRSNCRCRVQYSRF
jgi:hypothetical protein